MASQAQTGDFLGTGSDLLSPFGDAQAPMYDQAKLEEYRRGLERERQRIEARDTGNANRTQKGTADTAYTTPDAPGSRPTAPGSNFSAFMNESLDTVKQHPWLPLLPLAPLAMAALAPAATGAGTLSGVSAAPSAAPAMSEAFTMTSPYYGATTGATVPSAAGATTAAAGTTAATTLPGMIGSDLAAAAPYLAPLAAGGLMYAADRATSGRTPEEKRLLEKQEQMAEEVERRREQVQRQSMDALGQQLMAFAPLNQAMAQMYGPEAAFSQEQFAAMAASPMKPDIDPAIVNYQGTDPAMRAKAADAARRIDEYNQAEEARRQQIMQGMPAPGPGPAPMQMPAPQAARRY